MTSARNNVEAEFLTRLLTADSNETRIATEEIMSGILERATGAVRPNTSGTNRELWHQFGEWLVLDAPYTVVVPFAKAIRASYPFLPFPLRSAEMSVTLFARLWHRPCFIRRSASETATDGSSPKSKTTGGLISPSPMACGISTSQITPKPLSLLLRVPGGDPDKTADGAAQENAIRLRKNPKSVQIMISTTIQMSHEQIRKETWR